MANQAELMAMPQKIRQEAYYHCWPCEWRDPRPLTEAEDEQLTADLFDYAREYWNQQVHTVGFVNLPHTVRVRILREMMADCRQMLDAG